MAASFWLDARRDGFTDRCVEYFRHAEEVAPNGRPMKRAYPTVTEAVELQGKTRARSHRGSSTQVSRRGMELGQRLVG